MKPSIARPLVIVAASVCVAAAAAGPGMWLDVPFVRQQKDGCGAAAISMVMRYWRQKSGGVPGDTANPQVILRALYNPQAHGVYASAMERYFRENGFAVYEFKGTWSDLAHHLAQGRPLIVCLKQGARDAPLHYVVVAGLDPAQNVVMVNDPARRKLLKLDRSNFEKSWKAMDHWTLLALPR